MASRQELSAQEQRVLAMLPDYTYDQIQDETGWSRGKIYALALRCGARKTEARIRERSAERKARQQAMLQELINTTATADVLDYLDALPDASVALHVTSVPYNLGKKYGEAAGADALRFTYFHGWLMQVISEMSRTLREGGVLALNLGKTRDWTDALMPMDVLLFEDLRRSGLTFQSRIIWETPHGLTPKRRLAERYETVLVFSKGLQATFNPTAARVPQKDPGKRAFKGPNRGRLSGHPLGAHPTDVWHDIGNVGHNHPDRRHGADAQHGAHPAPFPNKLARRLILLYSMPGELISDPFSGTGTVAEASIQTGRAFTGADLFYEDLRERRLAAAAPDLVSVLPGVSDQSVAVWQAEARRVDVAAPVWSALQEQQCCLDLFGAEAAR